MAQQTFIYQTLSFHLHVTCLPLLWSPKPQPPFLLSSRMAYKSQLPNTSLSHLFSGTPTCTSLMNLGHFLLLICLCSICLLVHPEELRSERKSIFEAPTPAHGGLLCSPTAFCYVTLPPVLFPSAGCAPWHVRAGQSLDLHYVLLPFFYITERS